jgi:5-methylcytosine-specific restriction protein A
MSKDINYIKMINSTRWLRLRKRKLTANPLCEDCKASGYITPATEVHHVVPCETAKSVVAMEGLMFDYNNLRSLCHDCHVITHMAMKSHSREAVQANVRSSNDRFVSRFLE